ncbi:MAG TPA: acetate kinase [Desulfobacterales bacterium]|nr:acetate kinase [Desulfobacterales bacterium]
MTILVLNTGSSSVKFALFKLLGESRLAGGIVERIGFEGTKMVYDNHRGDKVHQPVQVRDTGEAVAEITKLLTDKADGVIRDKNQVVAIGHRVVHGGEKITASVIIDRRVKQVIQEYSTLAPLHNPSNLTGIVACEKHFPDIPGVAVFDTAFHTTIPAHAYLYGLPYQMYSEDKIRRYGFHGTSHHYVCHAAADFLSRPADDLKIISCHLGNGCSITAIDRGKSIDTSMGFTPLEGLIMGTRSGDIDPAIVFYLIEHKKLEPQQVRELLNKQSGLFGLAGIGSSDLRDIFAARENGNQLADTAIRTFVYRIKKYLGAYTAALGGLDTIIFTAGIGENAPLVRKMVCQNLEELGIVIDSEKNAAGNQTIREIQHKDSRVNILVIPTNEEKEIALQVIKLLFTEKLAET